jgi:hypothetical protein
VRQLADKSVVGDQDVFVRVSCGGSSFDTHVEKGRLNPKFQHVAKFVIADPASATVKFTVLAKGTLNDDFLGEYSATLGGLTRGEMRQAEGILQQCKTNATIHFRLVALDFGAEPADLVAVTGVVVGESHKTWTVNKKPEPPVPEPAAAAPAAAAVAQPPPVHDPTFQQPQWSTEVQQTYRPNMIERAVMDADKKIQNLVGGLFKS